MNAPVQPWSDAEVQAFVDGELEADTTTRLAAQVRLDLALAQRVARERALRTRIAAAFSAVLQEPVPARLIEAMERKAGTPMPPPAPAARALPGPWWWSAAAAALLAAWWLGWRMPHPVQAPLVADVSGLRAGGMLAEALSQRLSAEGSREHGVLVSLSFKAGDGRYCRIFSLDSGIDGLACRSGGNWVVEATGRSPVQEATITTPRQASSELSAAVLAAMYRWQAGDALTREEERALRDRGWR